MFGFRVLFVCSVFLLGDGLLTIIIKPRRSVGRTAFFTVTLLFTEQLLTAERRYYGLCLLSAAIVCWLAFVLRCVVCVLTCVFP